MVYGRDARLPLDMLLKISEPCTTPNEYMRSFTNRMRGAFREVIKRQQRSRELNRIRRDRTQKRIDVDYELGDVVLIWGPVAARATHATTPKLLYRWSLPHVVTKRTSKLLYKILCYKKKANGDGSVIEKGPYHVNI